MGLPDTVTAPTRFERLRRVLWDALAGAPIAKVHLDDLLALVEESDARMQYTGFAPRTPAVQLPWQPNHERNHT